MLGNAHVDRASALITPFDANSQAFIMEAALGAGVARRGLTPRERSLITLALLTAGGHDDEVALLLKAGVVISMDGRGA